VPHSSGLSRRAFFQCAITYGAGVAIIEGLGSKIASAQAKVPQKAVSYQEKPKDAQRCDGCVNFQAPNACKLVDGQISPQGWCALFMKKA
jgi:hypothetical protein